MVVSSLTSVVRTMRACLFGFTDDFLVVWGLCWRFSGSWGLNLEVRSLNHANMMISLAKQISMLQID